MGDFHFLRPYWLLAVLPALTLWWLIWRQQDLVATWRQIMDPHLLGHLLVGLRKQHRLCPIHILLVIWILSVVALAGPVWRKEPLPFADEKAGLVVILKVSGTMNATDVQPSHLERAKYKLRDLLALRKGSPTSLIVYSGSAHLVMPLTKDNRIISAMVEDLTPELMPADGDALAQALELAESLLQKTGVPGSALVMADTVAQSQVQILSVEKIELPVQFLSLQFPSAPHDKGLQRLAKTLNGSVEKLTVDKTDVERANRRAQSELKTIAGSFGGQRWHDTGYTLIPLIVLCTLMWSRKGWVIR